MITSRGIGDTDANKSTSIKDAAGSGEDKMIVIFGMMAMAYALDHSHLPMAEGCFLWIASTVFLIILQAMWSVGDTKRGTDG
jgi:hypothetical protein